MKMTKDYRVAQPFWFGGLLREVGETIRLSAAEAKYRGDEIEPIELHSAPPSAQEDLVPTRSRRRTAEGQSE
ncbi:MAG: hypothetical protein Q4G22_04795 [Paracoccus sp. (in: a-proteobacteria)]|uniref:hypothetical protein n=1 Tax=Paracoccus sp. TaxID=267 RepID=UPI0026E000BD|nr:hypothetical protein [Paracoccus sp. (in: a-proteobacteria)]MDO5631137.1 hypothetical protein [Paracoccus sp. (in: a-proteobacteria)]